MSVLALADADAVDAVGDSALVLKDTFVSIATTVLPYAATLAAIILGWRLAKRFIKA